MTDANTLPAAFGTSCPIAHIKERLNVSFGKARNSENLRLRPPDCAASVVLAWNADLSTEEAFARSWLVGRGADSSGQGPANVQSPGTSPGPALQSVWRRIGMDVHESWAFLLSFEKFREKWDLCNIFILSSSCTIHVLLVSCEIGVILPFDLSESLWIPAVTAQGSAIPSKGR